MEIPEKLGKYEVRRELGRGAMGIVYEGFDPVIQRRVALKTVKSDQLESLEADEILLRFKREAQAAGRLTHANIVGVYEFAEDNGTVFIAMEFVEGKELKEYFDSEQRFPISEVRRIMSEILDALDYSHRQGVIHRDIKPANIILLANGTVKVADFGIARLETSTLTQAGSVLGTPSYMSPEQFMGQTVDGRSDIFSAGVVLYQFLTGERPFTGAFTTIMHKVLKENPPLPSELNVQVPMAFDAVVRKALAKRPEERYQTAAEFRQAIIDVTNLPAATAATAAAAADATVVAAPTLAGTPPVIGTTAPSFGSLPDNSVPHKSNSKALAGLAAVVVLIVVAGGLYSWHLQHSSVESTSPGSPAAVASNRSTGNAAPALAPGSTPAQAAAPSALAAAGSPAAAVPALSSAPVIENGAAVITAMGVVDPDDSRYQHDPNALHSAVIEDARRQLIQKAAALYIEKSSLDKNYAMVRDHLLAHSGDYIKVVLDEQPPVLGADGLMSAMLSASVNLRAVQKSLNDMSNQERIDFIRKNGDPKIAVNIISTTDADGGTTAPEESMVAENLLKDRIRSFGFRVVTDGQGASTADFGIDGQVHFKKLTAKLAASGLTIEKVVLTSWTVKATDRKSGEDIYTNTKIPEKQSWASEELALTDVGRLVGDEFSKSFFLEYFQYPISKTQLQISGLPQSSAQVVLNEMNGLSDVLNASLASAQPGATVINANLSPGPNSIGDTVQGAVLQPINKKLGRRCFSVTSASEDRVQVQFDPGCADAATLGLLESLPPASLMSAPPNRREDVVKNPTILKRMSV